MKRLIKNELTGWKTPEVAWLIFACAIIASLSIYWGDTIMGIISAITGVACVVCTGKGKLSAYLFGVINCVLYAIISYNAKLYGETLLNALYYVPMQFIGFYVWNKNMNEQNHEVKKIHMKNQNRILWLAIMIVATYVCGLVLKTLGDAMPFVDSFTTVSSIIAMILSVKMYSEQWWIWILVDVFSVYMWWCDFNAGSDNMATLLMWAIYLGNAIIMCIRWEKEAIKSKNKGIDNYEI